MLYTCILLPTTGSPSLLDDKKVVIGGDQLTRVRLQGAKGLRDLAPDQRKSFKNLSPIVCEMWHVKQDLLHVSEFLSNVKDWDDYLFYLGYIYFDPLDWLAWYRITNTQESAVSSGFMLFNVSNIKGTLSVTVEVEVYFTLAFIISDCCYVSIPFF